MMELIESIGQLRTPLPGTGEHEAESTQREAATRVLAVAPLVEDFSAAGYLTPDEVDGLQQLLEALQPLATDSAADPVGGWPAIHALADGYLDGDY